MAMYSGGGQIDRAQAELERHTVSSTDGRCLMCGVPGPCTDHERATRVFELALRLPQRVPGATQPQMIKARKVRARGWLTATR